ncbi:MAG TPA: hypothetical protein VM285_14325 [Polyangia bacterium]|nr:hypothetical protein [Polyangia bacterium]
MSIGAIRPSALALASLFVALGCGGKQPEVQEPVAAKPTGPSRDVFAPLDTIRLEHQLPVVIGATEDLPCFEVASDLVPVEADVLTRELLKEQSAAVGRVVRAWLADKLATSGVPPTLVDKWSVEVLDPVVLELPRDRVRFTESPNCLSKNGWLEEGRYLATSLLGGRKFAFKSSIPIGADVQQSMLETLGLDNIVVDSEALFVYQTAIGSDGQPMLNPEGNPLYTSPSGEFITQEQVPPPEKRMMAEWELHSEAPLYFAYRALPADGWRKEGDKDKCNVILIPEALQPQVPECPEFRDAAFTVSIIEGEEQPVSITVTTGKDEYKGVMLAWGAGTKVQVNDRLILWLMAQKVEVGVELFINSLVLDPRPLAEDGAATDDESYAGAPDVAKPQEPSAGKKAKPGKGDKGKKAEPEKIENPAPPAKKKGKASDSDALDDYLNR